MSVSRLPGPLIVDVEGCRLSDGERERLRHPLVGGLILFSRNCSSPEQLRELTNEVHSLRNPPLLVAIDHEGGRVQRCREGFTRLPAMRRLGQLWEEDPESALTAAFGVGYVLAAELRQCGVDLSFTPVLDLDWGRSAVIGDRAFHREPSVVVALAGSLIEGLKAAGMAACGKHFPGHGWAAADSHHAQAVDDRCFEALAADLDPYRKLRLDAVMPAHVIYSQLDSRPAGFSPYWIRLLRNALGFSGVIFSDDLSMAAAGIAGGVVERCHAAWNAGCDLLLLCNAPGSVEEVFAHWQPDGGVQRSECIRSLYPSRVFPVTSPLTSDPAYVAGVHWAQRLLA